MFKDNYKRTMEEIKPSDEAVANLLDAMQNEENTKRKFPKNTLKIAIVSCLSIAIIATSLFGIFKHSGIFDNNDTEFNGIRRAMSYDEIDDAVNDYYGRGSKNDLTYGLLGDSYGVMVEGAVTEDYMIGSTMKPDSVPSRKEHSDTNNQVAGVQEADFVKTDGNYIYYLSIGNQKLYIAEVSNGEMNQVASVLILSDNIREMLLINDTICIIANNRNLKKTTMWYYDISDRSNPILNHTFTQDGVYLSSRAIDTDVFVITSFQEFKVSAFNKKSAVIPEVNGEKIDANDIWIPEKMTSTQFTIVTAYDTKADKDEFTSAVSIIGASETMYSGKKNLYLTTTQSGYNDSVENGSTVPTIKTCIFRISLNSNSLTVTGTGAVPGTVLNQFSMDEYKGKLRVATNIQFAYVSNDGKNFSSWGERINRVYCLGNDMEIIGESGDMGKNESIKSVRFMDDIAYVVTFRQTDPLYAVDMSDPTNPTILSELKIDGFSTYMHQFNENLLLGIGYEADARTGAQTGLKLTMFDVTDKTDIKDISSYIMSWSNGVYTSSSAIYNHKAVLVSGSKNIIGIPLSIDSTTVNIENGDAHTILDCKIFYVFFEFDGNEIKERKRIPIPISYDNNDMRGLYIGNYSYIVSNSGIMCLSLNDLTVVSELKFD